jgi:hypothetical protein
LNHIALRCLPFDRSQESPDAFHVGIIIFEADMMAGSRNMSDLATIIQFQYTLSNVWRDEVALLRISSENQRRLAEIGNAY